MEYSRVEIRPGVWLTHLREEKFKTACFSVNLLSQLSRQTVSMNALVPYVLHRGTKLWPDMQALSERQEELFGTVVEPIVRRIGEIHCSGFYAGFPEDEYLPGDESVLSDAIGLSLSLLLDPVTRGGLLLPDYVESEQEKLLDMIAARVNNKRSYAVLRCMEEMCAFEDYAAGRLGDEAGARAINYKKLSRHYRMLLQTCPIELFYCGRQPVEVVARESQQTLPLTQCTKPKADTFRSLQQYSEPTVFFYDVPKSRQNFVVSYDAISALPTANERATMKLWNEYFGGGMSSVLFQNVREFRSLAYSTRGKSINTSLALHPNDPQAYITATGTQADKTIEAVATIDSLLRQMPMKEENLESARQSVLSDIQNDYPTFRGIAKYVANQRNNGYTSDPNNETARLLPAITAQDIVQFHQQHVGNNQSRVWIIIGDKKTTDLKALSSYGKIVELKKEDVYR